ncbi:hypothetical protein [Nocardioides dilutus]
MRLRILLGGVGGLLGAYGAFLLLSRQDPGQILNAATWLVSGVVLHDFVLAPVVVGLVVVGGRVAPVAARVPAAGALVVLGAATLLATPVLGRFGARPDNPTLLDRDYTAGWLALAGVVLLATVVATLVRSRRQQGE